ncbi:iron hydrogenase [Histomonas meleagridis]|uniref:iron hydrogenase n=1 Tax=Histomonas meleagridis TaxID=135588 RepID=UPI003559A503|nr:iron hydrogenase [Histomonas meleagridis]KAH0805666.1 iron hydrogenase [Histomonas meleagridis]
MLSSFSRRISMSIDSSTNGIFIDPSKCIGCSQCVKACTNVAGQSILKLYNVNGKKVVGTVSGKLLQDTHCIKCGQCTLVCPTAAIREKDSIEEMESIFKNPQGRVTICQTAPAIRISLSDALGLPFGTISTGKMVTAMKRLGFQYVFDTNYGADQTIVEEAAEFVNRLTKGTGPLPMLTSCCPAWVNYVEQSAPEFIPNLSTCRSPAGMLSSAIINDFVKNKGLPRKSVVNVAIMPCTAKKDEIRRPQLNGETDIVLTTREIMKMIKKHKIDFKNLPDTPFDDPYSECTGAGAIFCASGGVMEAAIRSAYKYATKTEMPDVHVKSVRGFENGIKISPVNINGEEVGVAVAQGILNAMKLLEKVKSKSPDVANVKFIEVMACPGGCICGGGSTRAKTKKQIGSRVEAVYKIDESLTGKCSHQNRQIKELYQRMNLGEPGSHEAHKYLHTHFTDRSMNVV